jgi:ATP/maltotriose-dependent transcriptional regulator MalT
MSGAGLVGRDEELALIARHLDEPDRAGVLLIGPAGVGKTRLARDAVAPIEAAGRTVIRATATRSSSGIAFGVLLDLLPPAGTEPSRVELVQHAMLAVSDAGTEAGRPIVLVDDAHLVDDDTASLLLRLAERSMASLVLTVRSGGPVPDAITALWKDDFAARIDLQPISPTETTALAEALLGGSLEAAAAHRIWEITGGNPLYIREVVRAAKAGGSLREVRGVWLWRGELVTDGQLADAVAMRLDEMDDDVRDVMHLVAVGESLPHPLLARVAGSSALHHAEQAELVVVDPIGDRVRPAHPLFGELVRASMTTTAVHATRARLARAVLDLSLGLDLDLGVVQRAVWFLSLEPADEAVVGDVAAEQIRSTLRDGATASNRLGDYGLAERLARHAIAHDAGDQATLALAISLVLQGRRHEADALLLQTLEAQPDDAWRGIFANTHVGLRSWDLDDAAGAFEVLERWTDGAAAPDALALLEAERANLLVHTGQAEEALTVAATIVEATDGHHLARCRAFEPMALAAVMVGRTDRAAELAPGLALRAMSIRDLSSLAPIWVATGYFTMLVSRGALDEANRLIDLIEGATPAHDEQIQALVLGGRGFIETRAGRAADGYEKLARSVAMADPSERGLPTIINLGGLADAAAMCGDAPAARDAVDRAGAALPAGMAFAEAMVRRVIARVIFAEGDLEGARELSRRLAEDGRERGWCGFEALSWYDALRYGARGPALDRLVALGPALQGPGLGAIAQVAAGLRAGDAEPLERAADTFRELGCLYDAAEVATLAAELHRRAGRQDLAAVAGARAQDWFGRCEGARSPIVLGPGTGPAGIDLTRREREVALAAASGRSNREIAESLSVSVRTVEGHLLRAYGKLGVSDRAGLAGVLGRT